MAMKKKLISLWSPVAGVGTTFTAIMLAKALAKKGQKVLMLDFDLRSPSLSIYFNSNDSTHCIDSVVPFAEGGGLSPRVLENNLQDFGGILYLRGTNSPDQAPYFKVEHLDQIVNAAAEIADFVVMDCGNILDNAATYVALNRADLVLSVLSKNAITAQHFEMHKGILADNFDLAKFRLVINGSHKEIFMETADLERYTGMQGAQELPLLDHELVNALNQGKWPLFMDGGSKQVKAYLGGMENVITTFIHEQYKSLKDTKKSGFSLFNLR